MNRCWGIHSSKVSRHCKFLAGLRRFIDLAGLGFMSRMNDVRYSVIVHVMLIASASSDALARFF
jgi:hypothetical protein